MDAELLNLAKMIKETKKITLTVEEIMDILRDEFIKSMNDPV